MAGCTLPSKKHTSTSLDIAAITDKFSPGGDVLSSWTNPRRRFWIGTVMPDALCFSLQDLRLRLPGQSIDQFRVLTSLRGQSRQRIGSALIVERLVDRDRRQLLER